MLLLCFMLSHVNAGLMSWNAFGLGVMKCLATKVHQMISLWLAMLLAIVNLCLEWQLGSPSLFGGLVHQFAVLSVLSLMVLPVLRSHGSQKKHNWPAAAIISENPIETCTRHINPVRTGYGLNGLVLYKRNRMITVWLSARSGECE